MWLFFLSPLFHCLPSSLSGLLLAEHSIGWLCWQVMYLWNQVINPPRAAKQHFPHVHTHMHTRTLHCRTKLPVQPSVLPLPAFWHYAALPHVGNRILFILGKEVACETCCPLHISIVCKQVIMFQIQLWEIKEIKEMIDIRRVIWNWSMCLIP